MGIFGKKLSEEVLKACKSKEEIEKYTHDQLIEIAQLAIDKKIVDFHRCKILKEKTDETLCMFFNIDYIDLNHYRCAAAAGSPPPSRNSQLSAAAGYETQPQCQYLAGIFTTFPCGTERTDDASAHRSGKIPFRDAGKSRKDPEGASGKTQKNR